MPKSSIKSRGKWLIRQCPAVDAVQQGANIAVLDSLQPAVVHSFGSKQFAQIRREPAERPLLCFLQDRLNGSGVDWVLALRNSCSMFCSGPAQEQAMRTCSTCLETTRTAAKVFPPSVGGTQEQGHRSPKFWQDSQPRPKCFPQVLTEPEIATTIIFIIIAVE